MSWGLGWKRSSESFRLSLSYGTDYLIDDPNRSSSASSLGSLSSSSSDLELGFRIDLDWTAGDAEDQVALRLQSQLMVALPVPQDTVVVELKEMGREEDEEGGNVRIVMRVEKRRETLRAVTLMRSGQQSDGIGVLTRLMRSDLTVPVVDGVSSCGEHWKTVTSVNLSGCGLLVGVTVLFLF